MVGEKPSSESEPNPRAADWRDLDDTATGQPDAEDAKEKDVTAKTDQLAQMLADESDAMIIEAATNTMSSSAVRDAAMSEMKKRGISVDINNEKYAEAYKANLGYPDIAVVIKRLNNAANGSAGEAEDDGGADAQEKLEAAKNLLYSCDDATLVSLLPTLERDSQLYKEVLTTLQGRGIDPQRVNEAHVNVLNTTGKVPPVVQHSLSLIVQGMFRRVAHAIGHRPDFQRIRFFIACPFFFGDANFCDAGRCRESVRLALRDHYAIFQSFGLHSRSFQSGMQPYRLKTACLETGRLARLEWNKKKNNTNHAAYPEHKSAIRLWEKEIAYA